MLSVDQERRPSVEDLLNLPQISLRLRERRLKDNMAKLKNFDESLRTKEKELEERTKCVEDREKELFAREEAVKVLEKKLLEKEKFNFSSNFGYSTSGQTAGTSSDYIEKKNLEVSGSMSNLPKKEQIEFSRSCYVCNMRESSCSCERDNEKEYTTSKSSKQKVDMRKHLDSPSQWIDTNVNCKVSSKRVSESMENFGKVSNFTNNIQNSVNIYEMFSERKASRGENLDGNIQPPVNVYTNRINSFKQNENFSTLQENCFNAYNNSVLFPKTFDRDLGPPEIPLYTNNANNTSNANNINITNQSTNIKLANNTRKFSNNSNSSNQMRISEQIPSSNKLINSNNLNESPNCPINTKYSKDRISQSKSNILTNNFKFDPSLYKESKESKESSNRKEEEFSEEPRKPPYTSTSKSRQSSKGSNTSSIYSSHKNLLTTATPQSDTYATLTSTPQMSNRLVSTPIKDHMKFSSGKYSSILTREPRSNSPSVGNMPVSNYNTINSVRKSKIPYK